MWLTAGRHIKVKVQIITLTCGHFPAHRRSPPQGKHLGCKAPATPACGGLPDEVYLHRSGGRLSHLSLRKKHHKYVALKVQMVLTTLEKGFPNFIDSKMPQIKYLLEVLICIFTVLWCWLLVTWFAKKNNIFYVYLQVFNFYCFYSK